MKAALLSLQSTQKLYDKTQERLTSGLKVSSAVDDPAAYYAAATLTNQADALETRLDNMDQAVQAINAADNGVEAMESLLSSMTAIVENAMATDSSDTDSRAALGKKFNDLVIQLSSIADDSAYGGTNLLDGQNVTVQMGEGYNDSTYTVDGFYVAGITQNDTYTNGEIASLESSSVPDSWGTAGAVAVTNYAFALNLIEDPTEVVGIQSYGVGIASVASQAAIASQASIAASGTTASVASVASQASVASVAASSDSWEVDWTDEDTYTDTLQSILKQIEAVEQVLENRSKLLSFDQSTISLREDYTEDFINTLEDGADELTLADVNEESANLLSLETSQSLAVQAMSLSNDQMQNVLRLLE
jgi:flagellin-like hook-associated protein FlgL